MLPAYGWMFRALDRLGAARAAPPRAAPRRPSSGPAGSPSGVGAASRDRLFPFDLVPRIVPAEDWAGLHRGPDPAGARAGGVPARRLRRAPDRRRRRDPGLGRRRRTRAAAGSARSSRPTRCASRWPGIDLVRDRAGPLVRAGGQPAGAVRHRVRDARTAGSSAACCRTWTAGRGRRARGRCRASCGRPCCRPPAGRPGADEVALLTAGPGRLGLVRAPAARRGDGHPAGPPRELLVDDDGGVPASRTAASAGVDVLYRRIDEEPAARRAGADGRPLGPGGLQRGRARARSRCSTRRATASADDKAVYALRAPDDRVLPGRGAAAGRRHHLPVRRPGPPGRGAATGSTSWCSSRSTATAARAS